MGDEGDDKGQQEQEEKGKKKRSLFQKLTMVVMPTANQLEKELPKCRVHVRVSGIGGQRFWGGGVSGIWV